MYVESRRVRCTKAGARHAQPLMMGAAIGYCVLKLVSNAFESWSGADGGDSGHVKLQPQRQHDRPARRQREQRERATYPGIIMSFQ